MIERKTLENTNSKYKSLTEPAAIFIASRLLFILVIILSGNSLSNILSYSDGQHYIDIANYGYYSAEVTAFFPVIPVIIRFIGIPGLIAINQICFFIFLYLLKKLGLSRNALLIAAINPVSFFSMILYTESIYMTLTLGSFYLYKIKKNRLLTGILIGLAVCTRNAGAMLFFAIFIAMFWDYLKKETKFTEIVITYIPATMISLLYPIYLQVKFSNWKIFMDTQYTIWSKVKSNIIKTLVIEFEIMFKNNYYQADPSTRFWTIVNESLSIILLVLIISIITLEVIKIIKTVKTSGIKSIDSTTVCLLVYVIACVIAFNSTIRDPYLDMPTISYFRYYLSLFPIYIFIDKLSDNKKFIILTISILLSFFTSYYFCLEYFFY